MTIFKKKILIVDDQYINLMVLRKILGETYDIVEARSGEEALQILREQRGSIHVVLLDLIMEGMGGKACLQIMKDDADLCDIPVIIVTQSSAEEVESDVLEIGAADYIQKPYKNTIILKRIMNILALRENFVLRNTAEKDPLTYLYNKESFFQKVSEIIEINKATQYCLIYMDIERFKIINDLFGKREGDKLLMYIGKTFSNYSDPEEVICCRYNADVFVVSMPFNKETVEAYINTIGSEINKYPLKFRLSVNFGIYLIEDIELPVNIMCDRASLALKSVVGKYGMTFAYYDDRHRDFILKEQSIENDMVPALSEGQFHVYLQPKFDLRDFSIIGAEALVRWILPNKDVITPDQFIPVFEKNGFITELDIFVWETTCQHLRKWLDNGWPVVPVSVNISRVDIYRPDICDILFNLVKKYNLPINLFELEITETAYTQNAEQFINTIMELKNQGFCISMDDFGSGYSSLNMLNEVPVDVLKLDMTLLRNIDTKNKGSNIINFVVNLAKWLNIPVISEGIETIEQVNFLRSIGCYHGQGYFFSRPLTIPDFENKMRTHKRDDVDLTESYSNFVDIEDIFEPNSQFNTLFNAFVGSLALYESKGDSFSLLRANDQFYTKIMPNCDDLYSASLNLLPCIFDDDRDNFVNNLQGIKKEKDEMTMEFRIHVPGIPEIRWHRMHLKIIHHSGNSSIYLAAVEDISTSKAMEFDSAKSEQRLQNILESCSINSFDIDFENKTLINNNFNVGQYSFPIIIEDTQKVFVDSGFVDAANANEVSLFFDNLFDGKPSDEIYIMCRKKDDVLEKVSLSYKIEFDALNAPVSGLCILQSKM